MTKDNAMLVILVLLSLIIGGEIGYLWRANEETHIQKSER